MKKYLFAIALFATVLALVSCECKEHTFTEWETTLLATCTEQGTEVRGCENCKYTEERATESLGHIFGEWVELSVPTCKDPYDVSHTCAVCGFSETQTMQPKGHIYDFEFHKNHVVHEHPSCFKEGVSKYICIVCNDPDDVIYEPIKQMEHRWEGGSCETPSYCIYCRTQGEPASGHDWSQYEYMCSKCGLVRGLGKG